MKKLVIFSVAAVLLLVVSAAVQPAHATCPNSRSFIGGYIYTPGICVDGAGDGPCDVSGGSLSPSFDARFWHVGNNNPTEGLGNDSDGFAAVPNWIFPYPSYPSVIAGDWSTDANIDGCIDIPFAGGPADKCMAIEMYDVDSNGNAVFALMTSPASPGGDYDFGGPFTLAPLPSLEILNSVRTGGGTGVQIQAIVAAAGFQPGLFLNLTGTCANTSAGATSLLGGYRLRYQTVPRGGNPPSDPNTGWMDCGAGVIPIGQPGTCNVPTGGDVDVFLAYSLITDGGSESGVAGGTSSRVQGGPNLAVPEPRIQIREGGKKVPVRSR